MDRSAFLVLHYQNSVAHPRGCWGKNLHPQIAKNDSYENAQSALASARSARMPVIYVNVAFRGQSRSRFRATGLPNPANSRLTLAIAKDTSLLQLSL